MKAKWNELRELLHKISSENLLSTESQLILVHGETNEKSSDAVFHNSIGDY